MHTRQSGAAHVPIMFFLLLLVLFLGTLGFAWVTLTENGDLKKARDEAVAAKNEVDARALLVEHYIADIGDVIKKPGEYKGRRDIYDGATLSSEGLMNPAEVKLVMDNACGAAEVSVGTSLENVLGAMVTRINQLKQRVSDISSERDKALTDKNAVDTKFSTTTQATSQTAREFQQSLDQSRSDFTSSLGDKDRTINSLQENLRQKDAQLLSVQEASAELEKELRGEIATLQNHNSALASREALRQPANTPDGTIIAARNGVRTAFINLGKKDLLQPDTIFRIKNPKNDIVKGYAKVIRVEQEKAEVELSGIIDPIGDYVREGDRLYNDLYTPGMSRTIYLMGRFSAPYNKDTLSSLLTNLGNRVVHKMGPGVDTVIVGNNLPTEENDGFAPIEDSDEYKLAVQLRVEFAPLIKIRDLVTPSR